MINLPWFCVNIYQNRSRSSGRKDWQVEGSDGLVQVENDTQTPAPVGKAFSQTAASKQRPKQDRRLIKKEAKSNPSALEREVATEKHQMRSVRKVCLVLGSSRLPRGRREKKQL